MTDQFGTTKRRLMSASTPVETGKAAELHRAFRLAMSRSLADVSDLMVSMGKSGQKRIGPEHVTALLADMSLIGVLTCDNGSLAFVGLDTNLVKAIVHKQTIGHVPKPKDALTRATLGEAALVSPVIDHVFGLVHISEPDNTERYTFYKPMACAKTLLLDTGDLVFDVHDFSVVLENGTVTRCVIGLPYVDATDAKGNVVEKSPEQMAYQLNLPVELNAVITNATRVWGDVADWTVGHALILAPETLFNVAVQSAGGRTEFHAQLGQSDGKRAVRLYLDDVEEPPSEVAQEPARITIAPPVQRPVQSSVQSPIQSPEPPEDEDFSDLDLEELDI